VHLQHPRPEDEARGAAEVVEARDGGEDGRERGGERGFAEEADEGDVAEGYAGPEAEEEEEQGREQTLGREIRRTKLKKMYH
jgi:uncharacterized protein YcfJ